jgi:hypothetical protein
MITGSSLFREAFSCSVSVEDGSVAESEEKTEGIFTEGMKWE